MYVLYTKIKDDFLRMIYDILSALHGYSGGIFRVDPETKKFKVFTRTEVNIYFSNGEVDQMNKILSVANLRYAIREFCRQENDGLVKVPQNSRNSYLSMLKFGMKSALIKSYDQVLADMEQRFLETRGESFMRIWTEINPWVNALKMMSDIIKDIESNTKKDAAIFDFIYRKFESSIGDSKAHLMTSLCLAQFEYALFNHIAKWNLTGCVNSTEFFIRLNKFTSPEKFELNINAIPFKISTETAEKILFVGNWTKIIQSRKDLNVKNLTDDMSEVLKKLRLAKGQRDELGLICPAPSRFNWKDLDLVINESETTIMRYIWMSCLQDRKLIEALKHLKNAFLLCRGDLYLNIYHEIQSISPNSSVTPTKFVLARKWNYAAWTSGLTGMETNFSLSVEKHQLPVSTRFCEPYTSIEKKEKSEDWGIWNRLYLTYDLDDLMALFLTPDHINRYGVIFRLLNQVRNARMRLEGVSVFRSMDIKLSLLRFKMLSWISNIESYFHNEVIQPEWTKLNKVFDSKDVKQFIVSHERYLDAISKKCFLPSPTLMKAFLRVVDICESFATQPDILHLSEFNRWMHVFYEMVVKTDSGRSDDYLASLITILNFNGLMAVHLNY